MSESVGLLNHTVAIILLVIGLLSGAFAVFREIQLMYFPAKATERKVFWGFVRIAFVIAAALLWFDEHTKVEQLLTAAQPSFRVAKEEFSYSPTQPNQPIVNVWLQNDGGDAYVVGYSATKVDVPPAPDKKYVGIIREMRTNIFNGKKDGKIEDLGFFVRAKDIKLSTQFGPILNDKDLADFKLGHWAFYWWNIVQIKEGSTVKSLELCGIVIGNNPTIMDCPAFTMK